MLVKIINPFTATQDSYSDAYTVTVTQIQTISRRGILEYLVKKQKIQENNYNYSVVTANPRNYLVDLFLSKGECLYYQQQQLTGDNPLDRKKIIKFPLVIQITPYDMENQLTSQIQNIGIKHFQVIQKIGEGSYAQIYLVERKYDRALFCLKKINKAEVRQKGSFEMIKNQFQACLSYERYRIRLYYEFQDTNYVYFIIDYCPYGDLYSIIKANKKNDQLSRMSTQQKIMIWMQIAFGIANLHQKGYVYRDLKPQNILINQKDQVKLCDMGFIYKLQKDQKITQPCGSYEYLAPQIIRKQAYNQSIDIYCLGLLFYELLTGSNPFEGITPQNIHQIKNKPINYQRKNISITLRDLLKKMMKERPQQRIGYQSVLQIFKHQFFKQNQSIVHKIIKGKNCIKNIKYTNPPYLKQRQQLDQKQSFIFPKGSFYNYTHPFFDVTEDVGPKFDCKK